MKVEQNRSPYAEKSQNKKKQLFKNNMQNLSFKSPCQNKKS